MVGEERGAGGDGRGAHGPAPEQGGVLPHHGSHREGLGMPPHAFISRELPLLQQFLEANDDLLEHAVFGVSAQGGDIIVASAKQSLLELDDALKRIRVRQDQDTGQDITKPIAWLLGPG